MLPFHPPALTCEDGTANPLRVRTSTVRISNLLSSPRGTVQRHSDGETATAQTCFRPLRGGRILPAKPLTTSSQGVLAFTSNIPSDIVLSGPLSFPKWALKTLWDGNITPVDCGCQEFISIYCI